MVGHDDESTHRSGHTDTTKHALSFCSSCSHLSTLPSSFPTLLPPSPPSLRRCSVGSDFSLVLPNTPTCRGAAHSPDVARTDPCYRGAVLWVVYVLRGEVSELVGRVKEASSLMGVGESL